MDITITINISDIGSYLAVSNSDKQVRILDISDQSNISIIAKVIYNCILFLFIKLKIPSGDITTGMIFSQDSKNLITTSSDGVIYIWKLNKEIKSNIEDKKKSLGKF